MLDFVESFNSVFMKHKNYIKITYNILVLFKHLYILIATGVSL